MRRRPVRVRDGPFCRAPGQSRLYSRRLNRRASVTSSETEQRVA